MTCSFESACSKTERAYHQLKTLEAKVGPFFADNPYPIRHRYRHPVPNLRRAASHHAVQSSCGAPYQEVASLCTGIGRAIATVPCSEHHGASPLVVSPP